MKHHLIDQSVLQKIASPFLEDPLDVWGKSKRVKSFSVVSKDFVSKNHKFLDATCWQKTILQQFYCSVSTHMLLKQDTQSLMCSMFSV